MPLRERRGVATGWTGVDMSTPLLPEVVPETNANPASFYWGRGRGVCNCCGSVGFPVNVWGYNLCWFTFYSHITSTTIPDTFSFLTDVSQIPRVYGVCKIQRMRQICCFCWASKSEKAISFRGLLPPDPLTRGSAPGPRWGLPVMLTRTWATRPRPRT